LRKIFNLFITLIIYSYIYPPLKPLYIRKNVYSLTNYLFNIFNLCHIIKYLRVNWNYKIEMGVFMWHLKNEFKLLNMTKVYNTQIMFVYYVYYALIYYIEWNHQYLLSAQYARTLQLLLLPHEIIIKWRNKLLNLLLTAINHYYNNNTLLRIKNIRNLRYVLWIL
jgi:hypothetical protein